jgi:hypothetical protein
MNQQTQLTPKGRKLGFGGVVFASERGIYFQFSKRGPIKGRWRVGDYVPKRLEKSWEVRKVLKTH